MIYPLASYLFSIFVERSIKLLKEYPKGIKINGIRNDCISLVHDSVVSRDLGKEMNGRDVNQYINALELEYKSGRLN